MFQDSLWTHRKGLEKKIHMSPGSFWHTKQFCHIFTPADQLLCSILHKNGPTTYNEHFTAYNIMTLVCAGWLHKVQRVLCTAFWSMDMTGVYACLFEAVCGVTTVPSHLNNTFFETQAYCSKPVSIYGQHLMYFGPGQKKRREEVRYASHSILPSPRANPKRTWARFQSEINYDYCIDSLFWERKEVRRRREWKRKR